MLMLNQVTTFVDKFGPNAELSHLILLLSLEKLGPVPMSDLYLKSGLSKSTVQRGIQTLSTRNPSLVLSEPSVDDRRSKFISLSRWGKSLIAEMNTQNC